MQTSPSLTGRRVPDIYRNSSGNAQDLKVFENPGIPTVKPVQPASLPVTTPSESKTMYFIQNNLAFSIFIFFSISLLLYLIWAFFELFSSGMNTYVFGIFKRPLPDHPELYFDVNCINSMNLADLLQVNQLERCRDMRPINRIGPPLSFSAPTRR